MVEWVLLGYLIDNPEGKKVREIAEQMSVEAPFITALLNKLEKHKIIKSEPNKKDKRAKIIRITRLGRTIMADIKTHLNAQDVNIFHDISSSDLESYLSVLKQLASTQDTF
jgi:DNA-binding MarR family transcriptional regulator